MVVVVKKEMARQTDTSKADWNGAVLAGWLAGSLAGCGAGAAKAGCAKGGVASRSEACARLQGARAVCPGTCGVSEGDGGTNRQQRDVLWDMDDACTAINVYIKAREYEDMPSVSATASIGLMALPAEVQTQALFSSTALTCPARPPALTVLAANHRNHHN
jgi:hypothetical protein